MKKFALSAALVLSSISAAHACPAPQPDASTLFSMIADPKTQSSDVRDFLKSHAIGWDAVNENCQTTFLASLSQNRNDLFETLYAQYKPDLNKDQPENNESIYSYVIDQGTVDNLKAVQSLGQPLSLEADDQKSGVTELMLASRYNSHADMIRYLLAHGFSAGTKTKDHETALIYAADRASLEVIQVLIKAHSDVNQVDKNGDSPLSLAAKSNPDPQVIYALMKAGANIDANLANVMLLSEVSRQNGDVGLIKNLIQRGASVNDGSVLVAAAGSCNPDIITTLIQAGASVNASSGGYNGVQITPLMKAAVGVCPEIVKVLIQAGAEVNAETEGKETALMLLVENPNYNPVVVGVIKELVDAGADLTLTYQTQDAQQGDYFGQTPLQFATNHGAPQTVLDLLTPKAN
jgi:ankyrin repeat protein